MSRYIDADKLILSMRECAGYEHNKHATTTWTDACEAFIDEIEDMLVDNKEDVAPVVYARWEWVTKNIYYCTECGRETSVEEYMEKPTWNYCPHCGAKMDADEEKQNEDT